MGAIRKYFKAVFVTGNKLLFGAPKIKRILKHIDKYDFDYRYEEAMKYIKNLTNVFNVEFHTEGFDKIPDKNVFFAVNHQSFYDPFISQLFKQKPIWIAKKEIKKFPFVGNIVTMIDTIYLDREDPRDGLRVYKEACGVLSSGKSLWVSVEGTRSKKADHSLNDFKPGSLKPAYTTQTDIVPICICGSWKVLDPHYCKKKIIVDVVAFAPIPYEQYKNMSTQELSDKLYKIIKEKDDELLIKHLKS